MEASRIAFARIALEGRHETCSEVMRARRAAELQQGLRHRNAHLRVVAVAPAARLVLVMVEITGKVIAGPDDLRWRIFEADAVGIADCREGEELEFPGHCDHLIFPSPNSVPAPPRWPSADSIGFA